MTPCTHCPPCRFVCLARWLLLRHFCRLSGHHSRTLSSWHMSVMAVSYVNMHEHNILFLWCSQKAASCRCAGLTVPGSAQGRRQLPTLGARQLRCVARYRTHLDQGCSPRVATTPVQVTVHFGGACTCVGALQRRLWPPDGLRRLPGHSGSGSGRHTLRRPATLLSSQNLHGGHICKSHTYSNRS